MLSIQEFYPLLSKPQSIVITMHQKPDGDAMGSALGMYHLLIQLGHTVTVISPTNWASNLNWMPAVKNVIDFEKKRDEAKKKLAEAEIIFCLDFNVLHRTKNLEPVIKAANCIKVLIDHHQQPEVSEFTYGVSNVHKSSTCEMVYDFMVEAGYRNKINVDIAASLYTGLMTDTGSFRFSSTSAAVHRIVAHFMELGLNHSSIHEHIYDSFQENRLRFLGDALLNKMEVLYEYNTAIMAISAEMLAEYNIKTGDTLGLVNYLLSMEGIVFGALLTDREEERRWSFRSKGDFDVNAFARKHFDGGGHKNAAGGKSYDTLNNTLNKFKQVLKLYEAELNHSENNTQTIVTTPGQSK